MTQLCFWTKIRTKQWLVLGALIFQGMRACFLCPKCDNFACLHTRQGQNELHLIRWFFFCQNLTKFFVQLGSITIAIDCNGLSWLIFEEKWPNYASGPKSAPSSDSFWVCRLFNVCVRVFCARNATILLVDLPAKIKMNFMWKDDFFFCQNRHLL